MKYNAALAEQIRREYPPGTKVALERMDDPYTKLQPGTIGVVQSVDDLGTVHCSWENGSSLGAVFGVDSIRKVTPNWERSIFMTEIYQLSETQAINNGRWGLWKQFRAAAPGCMQELSVGMVQPDWKYLLHRCIARYGKDMVVFLIATAIRRAGNKPSLSDDVREWAFGERFQCHKDFWFAMVLYSVVLQKVGRYAMELDRLCGDELLVEKARVELDSYINALPLKGNVLISKCSEISAKMNFLLTLVSELFNEAAGAFLLRQDNALEFLYQKYSNVDGLGNVYRDVIESCTDDEREVNKDEAI